ncbi:MAG TPA: type VI secretion system tube protein Hcp [Stellaceae bacterium]|nr:type VI secretion system tube protein Hcp [Stellaceae bacterium]
MAIDAFLQFTKKGDNAVDLNGETKDRDMAKMSPVPFEISNWSFGASNPTNIGSMSGGAGSGKVSFDSFAVTKSIDKASPYLFHTCCAGGHYQEVALFLRRSGGSSASQSGYKYLQFFFKMVAISNIEWKHGDPAPTEDIKFEYGALCIVYFPQKPTGAADTANKKSSMWDRVKNSNVFDGGYGASDPSGSAKP